MSKYSKYKNFMQKYIFLNFVEWNLVKSKLKVVHYKKGDIIHKVGDICRELMFVNSGLARAYILDGKGKDHTWSIFFDESKFKLKEDKTIIIHMGY